MSKFNFSEKDLKENGWEVLPDGVFFGFDLVDSHKTNIPTILSELIGFDSDAEGYDFLICAYRKEKSDEGESRCLMNEYQKLEWLHSQISELIDGVEVDLETMQYLIEDLREPYLEEVSDE